MPKTRIKFKKISVIKRDNGGVFRTREKKEVKNHSLFLTGRE
jgi:hypothetical protein